jgi:hypothetical protein
VTTLSTDKDAEKPDYADIIAGNIKWHCCPGKQFGNFLQN